MKRRFQLHIVQTKPSLPGDFPVAIDQTIDANDLMQVYLSCQRLFGRGCRSTLDDDTIHWRFTKMEDGTRTDTRVYISGEGVTQRFGYRLAR